MVTTSSLSSISSNSHVHGEYLKPVVFSFTAQCHSLYSRRLDSHTIPNPESAAADLALSCLRFNYSPLTICINPQPSLLTHHAISRHNIVRPVFNNVLKRWPHNASRLWHLRLRPAQPLDSQTARQRCAIPKRRRRLATKTTATGQRDHRA
jgi:hypothetical protein